MALRFASGRAQTPFYGLFKGAVPTSSVKFGGGPVGLSTIAVSVGEEPDTIEEAYEPFLIMEDYLERTPKGRVATPLAWSRLGLQPAR